MNIVATGFGASFGKTVRDRLREQGHQVFCVGRELKEDNHVVDFLVCRADDYLEQTAQEAFHIAEGYFRGPAHCLINNAGITHIDWTTEHLFEDFEAVMTLNVSTPFVMTKEFLRRVEKTGHPAGGMDYRVINTCSMAAKMGFRACPAYPASKAALTLMTQGWAREYTDPSKPFVRFYGIAPGSVDSSGMKDYAVQSLVDKRGMSQEQAEEYNAKSSPLGYIPHDDIWKVFDFLVNDAPDHMTGSVVYLPGGSGL